MSESKPELTAVGRLTSYPERGKYQAVDELASLFDQFEHVNVKADGYDNAGHREWEVRVVEQ